MNGTKELDQELSELKGFIADLKADRAAQKEKEKKEGWTKYTAISLVCIAVITAVASQLAGKYSSRVLTRLNDSTFYQAQASDQWSYYQAKSIKQNLYEALRELTPKAAEDTTAPQNAESFKAKIAKYEDDKARIMTEAKSLEEQRNRAREAAADAGRHASAMGTPIVILQVAVALSSICLVTKKRPLWYCSLVLAAVATARMLQVWLS